MELDVAIMHLAHLVRDRGAPEVEVEAWTEIKNELARLMQRNTRHLETIKNLERDHLTLLSHSRIQREEHDRIFMLLVDKLAQGRL